MTTFDPRFSEHLPMVLYLCLIAVVFVAVIIWGIQ
jgi:hypothetical protein